MKRLFILTFNRYQHDSRIEKEFKSIESSKLFDSITLFASHKEGLDKQQRLSPRAEIIRVVSFDKYFPKNILQLIPFLVWCLKITFYAIIKKPLVVHCNDLETLPAGFLIKLATKSKIVYDAHELEIHRVGMSEFTKKIYTFVESMLIKYVDGFITVSSSIMDWYKTTYIQLTSKAILVRNITSSNSHPYKGKKYLKKQLGIKKCIPLFIYVGGLKVSRNINTLLDFFSKNQRFHVLFMGFGELAKKTRIYATQYQNIHFLEPVETSKIKSIIEQADIGLLLTDNSCLNHKYSLPNKLFQYLSAGIPILASNFPDIASYVKKFNAGWLIEPNKRSIENFIRGIKINEIMEMKENLNENRPNFSWISEERNLINLYQDLIL